MAVPPSPGIYVPVPTFFSAKIPTSTATIPGLNLALQVHHSLHLARSGVKGLILAGSTGEGVHLSRGERKALIVSTRRELLDHGFPSSYPLIMGVANDCVEECLALLKDAAEASAQFGMVVVPNYFAMAGKGHNYQAGVVSWFKAVADASPIPLLIYHYPAVSNNVPLSVLTYRTLAAHPNIIGCKLSHGNVAIHTQLANLSLPNFFVFTGLGQQLFPVLAAGCHGAIDGLAGVYPRAIVRLYELAWEFMYSEDNINILTGHGGESRSDKLNKIRWIQTLVSRAEEFVEVEGVVGIKFAVGKELFLPLDEGWEEKDFEGRPPLQGGLDPETWAKWEERILTEMREFENSL